MEYSLRCNRFREQPEKILTPCEDYRLIRNRMRDTSFEHCSYQNKGLIFSPEKVKPIDGIKMREVRVEHVQSVIVNPENQRVRTRTEFAQSTDLQNRRV
jgi:hypothetical protein